MTNPERSWGMRRADSRGAGLQLVAYWLVATSMLGLCHAFADDAAMAGARASISADDLRSHIEFLASDALKGRKAGSDGARAAAAYIATRFRAWGLTPESDGFRQEFGESGLQNVVGRWGPAESTLRPIIVSAHYDHVGTGGKGTRKENEGQIHNGADDNASGTALVLELAEAVSKLEPRERPVLFALWDGEEQGLLGSKYDANRRAEAEQLPLMTIVSDMIGRASCRRVYCYGTRTAYDLRKLVTAAAADLDDTPDALSITYLDEHLPRSDHWPFYENDVPYLLFHTGVHDEYHRPTDDADLLDYASAEAISRLCFDVLMASLEDGVNLELDADSKDLPKVKQPPRSRCEPEADRGEALTTSAQAADTSLTGETGSASGD